MQEVWQADFLELTVKESKVVPYEEDSASGSRISWKELKEKYGFSHDCISSVDSTQEEQEVNNGIDNHITPTSEVKIACEKTENDETCPSDSCNKDDRGNGDNVNFIFSELKSLKRHITCCPNSSFSMNILPANTFDVVVFSLFLSYFPSCRQRWSCCVKAHKLLKNQGLLIIIESDSSHQNKNTKMIKSWKTALESLGFARYKYEKLEHLHCMAFRKSSTTANLGGDNDELLFIPQDFQDDSDSGQSDNQRNEEDDNQVADLFCALSDIVIE